MQRLLTLLALAAAPSLRAEFHQSLTLKAESTFDDNVYLYEVTNTVNSFTNGPIRHVPDISEEESMVTSAEAALRVDWTVPGPDARSLAVSYIPRFNIYHDEPTESHAIHPLDIKIAITEGSFDLQASGFVQYTDGDDQSPLYLGVGGAPAIGAFEVRDRREAIITRHSARLRWTGGPVFLRAAYNGYTHDFRAEQLAVRGYCNYVDRCDFSGGLDAGFRLGTNTWLFAGYRYGFQHQDRLFLDPVDYSNDYQRALAGIEGKPFPWLELRAVAGPSFHRFGTAVNEDLFGRNQNRIYVDASLTLKPTRWDTIQTTLARFEQMSSGGCGAYEDIAYNTSYTHKFGAAFDATGFFNIRRGEFEAPATRDDTIYYGGAGVVWRACTNLSLSAKYSHEWGESDIPATPAREYHRNQVSLGVTRSF